MLPMQWWRSVRIGRTWLVRLREGSKPADEFKLLFEALAQRAFPVPGLQELQRRHRFIRPLRGVEQLLLVVCEDHRLLPPTRHRHVETPLVGCREGLARLADENLVHRPSFSGMRGYHVAVSQMPKIPPDDPAMIHDGVALRREAMHREQAPVVNLMPATFRHPVRGAE